MNKNTTQYNNASSFCHTGVNLLIGTETGLMLLDRSGQGKVYQLISRRRFQQMEVLEGQNILVTVSGKKNRVRVYYLSWLKSKILRTDGVSDVCMPPGLAFSLILEDKACSSQWNENIKSNTSHEQMVWFHFSLSNVRSWLCLSI